MCTGLYHIARQSARWENSCHQIKIHRRCKQWEICQNRPGNSLGTTWKKLDRTWKPRSCWLSHGGYSEGSALLNLKKILCRFKQRAAFCLFRYENIIVGSQTEIHQTPGNLQGSCRDFQGQNSVIHYFTSAKMTPTKVTQITLYYSYQA